jgi:hypothetical protein
MDVLIAIAVLMGVGWFGWQGGKALERTFQLLGASSAGPRPYPDQDPAPASRS